MRVRTRVLIIAAVAILSVWAIYPPDESIKLGLDLKGGVHLVLRVETDEALRLKTQATVERLRNRLVEARIAFRTLDVTDPAEFRVEGVQDHAAFRGPSEEAEVLFDHVARGDTHTFRIKPATVNDIRRDTVQQALHTIERRVNELGVAEPVVARYSEDDQILVQLPGVEDVDRAKQIIKSTAQLRLTLVEQGPFPSRDAALQAYNNALPRDLEVLPWRSDSPGTGTRRSPVEPDGCVLTFLAIGRRGITKDRPCSPVPFISLHKAVSGLSWSDRSGWQLGEHSCRTERT